MKEQYVGLLLENLPYILFGTVFLFIGLSLCAIAIMRRSSRKNSFPWLGIWSTIEGAEYLFGSLATLGLLPHWLLVTLHNVFVITSFSVVVIALLAFLNLSQGLLRLILKCAIVAGLAVAVAGIALTFITGSAFSVMPFNHLVAAISITSLAIVAAVPALNRRFLILPNRFVLSTGILLFAAEAIYGNLSLPFGLPTPPEILDPIGFAVLLFCFGFVAAQRMDIRWSNQLSS